MLIICSSRGIEPEDKTHHARDNQSKTVSYAYAVLNKPVRTWDFSLLLSEKIEYFC